MVFSSNKRLVPVCLLVLSMLLWQCDNKAEQSAPLGGHRYIAHAMGAVDGLTLTNSREAFEENYNKGRRVFEVDFAITSDYEVVGFHKSPNFGPDKPVIKMSYREFLDFRYQGKYTPLDVADVLDLLDAHPDMYIVTDTKYNFGLVMYVLKAATIQNQNLLGRIIPQIYSPKDYDQVKKFPVREIIYTLYKDAGVSDDDVFDFVRERPDITVVTMSTGRFSAPLAGRLSNINRHVFVHTINNAADISNFRGQGARGFYTDSYFE